MNLERNRLQSFIELPVDVPINPVQLAEDGFFFTKRNLTIECFSCHKRFDVQENVDSIVNQHRTYGSSCHFVLHPTCSDNIPFNDTDCDYKNEISRLKTFSRWPISHIVSPVALTRAGFYYLQTDDSTRCAYCKGVVGSWEEIDDPDIEHIRYFLKCPFVINEIIPRLSTPEISADDLSLDRTCTVPEDNLHKWGLQAHKGPKHAKYRTISARLNSFDRWPHTSAQNPQFLAEAGFFYPDILGDQVRCFHCDGGLQNWEPNDDPWIEHARWFPDCSFVNLVKGHSYVNGATSIPLNSTYNTKKVMDQNKCPQIRKHLRHVTERDVQEELKTSAALTALSIGLSVERVKTAIREKLLETGVGYTQPDALVEAALNVQQEEEHESPADDTSEPVNSEIRNILENLVSSTVTTTNTGNKAHSSESYSNNGKNVSLEEENRVLREARQCKICMDAELGVVFLPCGHLTTCVNCAPNLESCPVCRATIKASVRTFLH